MSRLPPFKKGFLIGIITFGWVLLMAVGAVAVEGIWGPEKAFEEPGQRIAEEQPSIESLSSTTLGGGLLIFSTTETFNGEGPAGYGRAAMHAACRAADSHAHFCTLQEIETAWKAGGVNFATADQVWVDNAVTGTTDPGYTGDFQVVSDWYGGLADGDHPYNCNGWTASANANRGLVLYTGASSPSVETCDDLHPIACCRNLTYVFVYLPVIRK